MINDIKINEGDAVTIDSEVLIMPIGEPHIILFEFP
jgi:hypothetical protein